jgi:hypothetical protein
MTALLPGSSSAGALPPGKAGGAMVTGGASMLAKRGAAGGYAAGVRDGVKKGMGKEPIWSSGTTSGGEYLSVADRKAIFRKQKINAAKFVGRSASAAGGAIVSGGSSALGSAINPRAGGLQAPDSGADAEPQNSKIGSRVKALEDLVAEISESVKSNSKKITLLKNVVKSHIQRFADFLKNDSEQKRKELLQQQQAEAKAIEEGQRDAAEEGLEAPNKMKKTLLQPVQMVGKKVGGILQKLKDAFLVLFAGWMTNRGFEAIKAFMDGDKEKLKEIRNNVLGALGVVGGVFLLLSGGLLALPGIIASVVGVLASVGGAILAFLFSPPGLITLAIAAGIAGIGFGLKALGTRAAGGKGFSAARSKEGDLEDKANELGVIIKGDGGQVSVNGVMKDVMEFGTEEQKAAFMEHQKEKKRLDGLKKNMDKEIKDYKKQWKADAMASKVEGEKVDWAYWNPIRDENIAKIKAKYNDLALSGSTSSDASSVTPSTPTNTKTDKKVDIGKVTPTTTPGPVADPKPNVVMKKAAAPAAPAAPQGSSGSPTTSIPSIPSADPDNFYVMYSKMHYNVVT